MAKEQIEQLYNLPSPNPIPHQKDDELYMVPPQQVPITESDVRAILGDSLNNFDDIMKVQKGWLQSGNFVTGVSGWQLTAAGNLEANTGTFRGSIKGGQTDYNTGTGFFLGQSASLYKFSIGDGTVANSLTWDGTTLLVKGQTFSNQAIYGDASDGAATLDGTNTYSFFSKVGSVYTLTRDVFFTNLTVNSGATLNTGSFKIFGTGTLTNSGTIHNNGNAGGNGNVGVDAGGATTGGTAGAALANGSLFGSIAGVVGGQGGAAGLNNGSAGTLGLNATAYVVGSSTAGNGGTGASGATGGGAGQAAGTLTTIKQSLRDFYTAVINLISYGYSVGNGSGGGGGGGPADGTNTASGGSGGGSGSNGGTLFFAFKTIINNAASFIQVNGGNGGNGGNGKRRSGGGGGGNGGNGGIVYLLYATYTNNGTVQVNGGAKGNLGIAGTDGPSHDGSNGTDGQAGQAGLVLQLQI